MEMIIIIKLSHHHHVPNAQIGQALVGMDREESGPVLTPEEEECLRERKWWCFLLSSIFTFLMGIFSVLIVRALASLCCRKRQNELSQEEQKKNPGGSKKTEITGSKPR